jgi:hypothetical protein
MRAVAQRACGAPFRSSAFSRSSNSTHLISCSLLFNITVEPAFAGHGATLATIHDNNGRTKDIHYRVINARTIQNKDRRYQTEIILLIRLPVAGEESAGIKLVHCNLEYKNSNTL